MNESPTPTTAVTFAQSQKTTTVVPASPTIFTVVLSNDKEHLDFTLGQVTQTKGIAGYKVYFAAESFAGSPVMPDQATIAQLFKTASLVLSVTSAWNNIWITLQNRLYVGAPGWFFAVSYSSANVESVPTNPIYNPSVYADANPSEIPQDVSNVEAYFEPIAVQGRTVIQVTVAAKPPITARTLSGTCDTTLVPQSVVTLDTGDLFVTSMVGQQITINGSVCIVQSFTDTGHIVVATNLGTLTGVAWSFTPLNLNFAGFQVYLQNYLDNDPSMTSYEEGAFFALPTQMLPSGMVEGKFTILPDAPPVYSVGGVDIVTGSPTVKLNAGTPAQWNAAWAGIKRITVVDGSDPSLGGNYYDDEVTAVSPTAIPPTLTVATSSPAWLTSSQAEYAIYSWVTGTQTVAKPHKVRLYFVSVSRAGTRRPDVLNSPYVELPFGFTGSLPLPLEPNSGAVTIQGITASISWTLDIYQDPTIDHFNVYRQRVGTFSAIAPSGRPVTSVATVKYDRTMILSGVYSYNDHDFLIDPNTTPYDFNPADPAAYWYYVTTVNIEGTENPFSYAGVVNVSGTTVTFVSGDHFQLGMVGETITIGGIGYEVTAVASSTSLTLDSAPTSGSGFTWTMGCVIMIDALVGNTGGESDPSIYRDNMWNRLYNSDFYTTKAQAGNLAVHLPLLSAYSFTTDATDGQLPWKNFDPNYKDSGTRDRGGVTGTQADAYTVWEYDDSGQFFPTASTSQLFIMSNSVPNGEILLSNSTGCGFCQLVSAAKFLTQEDLVFHVAVRAVSPSGTPGGIFGLIVGGTDAGNSIGPVKFRWFASASFPAAMITNTPQRLIMLSKLWVSGKYATPPRTDGIDAACVYSFSGSSPTGTYVSGDRLDTMFSSGYVSLVNNPISISPHYIVSTGSGTVTLDYSPVAGNISFTVTLQYDHILFEMGTLGVNTANLTVAVSKPMVNGGKLPANYTDVMNSLDWPGGRGQNPLGGGDHNQANPCVIGSTMILTPKGAFPASMLKEGDHVISWRGKRGGVPFANTIKKVHVSRVEQTIRLFLSNGAELHCTDSHPIAVYRNFEKWHSTYIEAGKLSLGDRVETCTAYANSATMIVAIERIPGQQLVYNFTLDEKPHNYIANGFLSHNKPLEQLP